ncbi:MAG: hypothetical protein ACC661_05070, partial [Verrucomicrobiales bacterium]
GDYSFLNVIGNFTGANGDNDLAGVDLASFQTSSGNAAYDGARHIDLIGAPVGETNQVQQRLSSVLNQTLTGLAVGQSYRLTYRYSTTSYVSTPREFGVRIDAVVGSDPLDSNNIYSTLVTAGFTPPDNVLTAGDVTGFLDFGGPIDPLDYSTRGISPQALDDTGRTVAANANSMNNVFDEVPGNGSEAPVSINWRTGTFEWTVASGENSVRLAFFNNTNPFAQDEAEYHYGDFNAGDGTYNIWFGNEVGMLLDGIVIEQIPEPGIMFFMAVSAFLALARRHRATQFRRS